MLNGAGSENGNKINRSNSKQKNKLARSTRFCTFLCRCFDRLQCCFAWPKVMLHEKIRNDDF